jgi:hypothetical protein
MRAILLTLAIAACGSSGSGDPHEVVACDSDWTDAFPTANPSDGCEAACASLEATSTDASCTVDLGPGFPMVACDPDNGGFFIDWGGVRGCCFLHGDDFSGAKFHECEVP